MEPTARPVLAAQAVQAILQDLGPEMVVTAGLAVPRSILVIQ
jgi:hypothetical protein